MHVSLMLIHKVTLDPAVLGWHCSMSIVEHIFTSHVACARGSIECFHILISKHWRPWMWQLSQYWHKHAANVHTDHQHRRLVRYYKRLGFQPIVEVGDRGPQDLPHLLVWGGAGTRMDGDVEHMLSKWSAAVRCFGT